MRNVSQGAWIGLRHYCSGGKGRVLMCRWVTMCTSVSFAGLIRSCQEWVTTTSAWQKVNLKTVLHTCMYGQLNDMLQWWHILWNAHMLWQQQMLSASASTTICITMHRSECVLWVYNWWTNSRMEMLVTVCWCTCHHANHDVLLAKPFYIGSQMSTMYLLLQGTTFQLNMSLFPYLPLMFGIRLIQVELHPWTQDDHTFEQAVSILKWIHADHSEFRVLQASKTGSDSYTKLYACLSLRLSTQSTSNDRRPVDRVNTFCTKE